jgi:hypothetical protein
VFREAGTRLGALAPCLPDGDQAGWIRGVFSTYVHHPDLEQSRVLVMDGAGAIKTPMYRLRPGHELRNLRLGPFGFATHAARSYEDFKRLRQQGVIAAGTRFQVSLPSPLISIMVLEHPFAETLPAIVAAFGREIAAIRATVPAADLAIQWDVCEPIIEETLRRPGHPTPFIQGPEVSLDHGPGPRFAQAGERPDSRERETGLSSVLRVSRRRAQYRARPNSPLPPNRARLAPLHRARPRGRRCRGAAAPDA